MWTRSRVTMLSLEPSASNCKERENRMDEKNLGRASRNKQIAFGWEKPLSSLWSVHGEHGKQTGDERVDEKLAFSYPNSKPTRLQRSG